MISIIALTSLISVFVVAVLVIFSNVPVDIESGESEISGSDAAMIKVVDGELKNVLFLSSYAPGFESFFDQIQGVQDVFRDEPIKLDIEFMDTKRFDTHENRFNFYQNIKYKLERLDQYDALIVADDNALDFVREYQHDLFADIPIVFMSVNNVQDALDASENENITGVIEAVSIVDTIECAHKFNSDAKRVVALVDGTNSGQAILEAFYKAQSHFPDLEFAKIDLTTITFDEFSTQVSMLGSDDIVLLLAVYSDSTGKRITFEEGLKVVLDACNQPVYHLVRFGIGEGIIGGKVVAHYEQGKLAAMIVNEVFLGTDISQILPVLESPNQYLFDYEELTKYGYNASLLPPETIYLNKQSSFLNKYWQYVIVAVLLISMQMVIIFVLITNIHKRKLMQQMLNDSRDSLIETNGRLENKNSDLSNAVEALRSRDEHITKLVYKDALTGLDNRLSLSEKLDELVCEEGQLGTAALLFIDIDNFKYINDTFGHDVGDEAIKRLGDIFYSFESDDIIIGRFGGDEFLIIVLNLPDKAGIETLIKTINVALNMPIEAEHNSMFITISIGIALFMPCGNRGKDLIKKADLALNKAKRLGRNTHVYYDESMEQKVTMQMSLQNAVSQAFKNNQFELNYQPIIDAKANKIVSFESLLRWKGDQSAGISPYQTIRCAEQIGLIIPLGYLILADAIAFAKRINKDREQIITVAVNISAVQLMHSHFYERIIKLCNEYGVPTEWICLEVTETILLESLEFGITIISKLKEAGFQIALDDFGTGYSSLSYFNSLPITKLKIDKSFVDSVAESAYQQRMIQFFVQISHDRSIDVVAEGVETKEQMDALRMLNCDFIQGYLFSKAVCEEEAVALANGHNCTDDE